MESSLFIFIYKMEIEFSVVEADNRKEFEDRLNSQVQFGFKPIPETFRAMVDSRYSCTVFCIMMRREEKA